MEAKTWTTPEELIEMTHWLSDAPGKRWVKDCSGRGATWGVDRFGNVGFLSGNCSSHVGGAFAPYSFLCDESEPKPVKAEQIEAIVRRCESAFGRIARRVAREEVAAATTGPGYTLWPVYPGPEKESETKPDMDRSAENALRVLKEREYVTVLAFFEDRAEATIRRLVCEELAKAEVVKDTDGKLRIVTGGA